MTPDDPWESIRKMSRREVTLLLLFCLRNPLHVAISKYAYFLERMVLVLNHFQQYDRSGFHHYLACKPLINELVLLKKQGLTKTEKVKRKGKPPLTTWKLTDYGILVTKNLMDKISSEEFAKFNSILKTITEHFKGKLLEAVVEEHFLFSNTVSENKKIDEFYEKNLKIENNLKPSNSDNYFDEAYDDWE